MRIAVFKFNRHAGLLEDFEDLVNDYLADSNDITEMKVSENYNGDVLFTLTEGDKKNLEQEIYIVGLTDLDTIVSNMNATLEHVTGSGKTANHINVITLGKSPRAVGAMIVVRDTVELERGSGKVEKKKQTKKSNAKPNRRSENESVSTDRSVDAK